MHWPRAVPHPHRCARCWPRALLLGAFGARDQRIGLGEIGFARARVEARFFTLLVQRLALRLGELASAPARAPCPPCDRRCTRDARRGRDPSAIISATTTAVSASFMATGALIGQRRVRLQRGELGAHLLRNRRASSGTEAQPAIRSRRHRDSDHRAQRETVVSCSSCCLRSCAASLRRASRCRA